MKNFFILLLFSLFSMNIWANNGYTDFNPKYRSLNTHYNIDQIEYTENNILFHVRIVAQKDGVFNLHPNNNDLGFHLYVGNTVRPGKILPQLEISNIAVNKKTKAKLLSTNQTFTYAVKRGDLISFCIHFDKLPRQARITNLVQHKYSADEKDKLNCFDILIKSSSSPLLGNKKTNNLIKKRFESKFASYINVKSRTEDPIMLGEANKKAANEPIDYKPQAMTSIKDIECNRRLILPQVKFRDNTANFSKRIKAVADIRIVVKYLKSYPNMILNLHGHTDIHGIAHKNLEISRLRALEVKKELLQLGIDHSRVKIFYHGGTRPILGLEKGESSNRRVEFEAVCPK